MANKITYPAGVNQVGLTASRFTADTSGGNVTLLLPSIAEIQNFMQNGSGINVSGTFNYAFEKVGNGSVTFQVAKQDETINGNNSLVVNDIGSGIIFISSDNSWGIVNFSKSNNQIITSKVSFDINQFDASRMDNPIVVVPAIADALIIPTHIILTIVEADSSGLQALISYGYVGGYMSDINVSGLVAGTKIIVPIIAPQVYDKVSPVGLGFGVYKKSGSVAATILVPSFDVVGN
jgi:hypothetical protein